MISGTEIEDAVRVGDGLHQVRSALQPEGRAAQQPAIEHAGEYVLRSDVLVQASEAVLAPASERTSCPDEVFEYPWPTEEACSVAWCESRWQPWAVNGSSYGLFQLWSGWASHYGVPLVGLSDAVINTRLAFLVWRDHGRWSLWSCKPG